MSIEVLLDCEPYKKWQVDISIDDDTDNPILYYVFTENNLELLCDEDGRIRTAMLQVGNCANVEELLGIPFRSSLHQVREYYGTPSKKGERSSSPYLGESGAWDRFSLDGFVLHFEYGLENDEVVRITLMRNDVAP